jgi:uncharacterized membrane protein YraQ (UPF0718 family)
MAWEDILIGFTIAGFVAVLIPESFWTTLFLADAHNIPDWLVTLENAMVTPFVVASTFIGSMGNIPLATVLNQNGVLFAIIMGFIYSDLMVPPLVHVNAKYYSWRVALYICRYYVHQHCTDSAYFKRTIFSSGNRPGKPTGHC